MSEFHLDFLAADKDFYKGPCCGLVLPLSDGKIGIYAGHTNMIGAVVPGEAKLSIEECGSFERDEDGKVDVVVGGGLVKVEDGNVTVLVDSVEFPSEIDENRAKRAAQIAQEELLHKQSMFEYRQTQAALSRAMARLNAKHHKD